MSFYGIFFISLIVLLALAVFAVIFLIVTLLIRKKHPKASKVFLFLSLLNIFIVVSTVVWFMRHDSEPAEPAEPVEPAATVEPPDDTYNKYIRENDIEKLDKFLDEHPDMIYYNNIDKRNNYDILAYGMAHMNVDILQTAVNHGAVFDDPRTFYQLVFATSFEMFFSSLESRNEKFYRASDADDRMIETVRFMIEHGADLNYYSNAFVYKNFYEHAADWVSWDGFVSDKDNQLLELIASHMDNADE